MSITYQVNTLEDYKQLIYDLLAVGYPENNEFSRDIDEDGMSLLTSFTLLEPSDAIEYLGLDLGQNRGYEDEEDFDGNYDEWEFPTSAADIKFNPSSQYEYPEDKDFPIIIDFNYSDTFDRVGNIKVRNFLWWSIGTLVNYKDQSIATKKSNWDKRYMKEHESLYRYQESRELEYRKASSK